jgi:uncharacterized membrane protein YtjA (UPF0391 family)
MHCALAFLVVAMVAALFGFTDVAGAVAGIAQILVFPGLHRSAQRRPATTATTKLPV